MGGPDDRYSPEELDAMGDQFFRWRYCPSCRTELTTIEEVPPYSWVHVVATGEHRSRPTQRHYLRHTQSGLPEGREADRGVWVQMLTMIELPDLRLVVRHGIAGVDAEPVRAASSWWQERTAACSRSTVDGPRLELQEQRHAARARTTAGFTTGGQGRLHR